MTANRVITAAASKTPRKTATLFAAVEYSRYTVEFDPLITWMKKSASPGNLSTHRPRRETQSSAGALRYHQPVACDHTSLMNVRRLNKRSVLTRHPSLRRTDLRNPCQSQIATSSWLTPLKFCCAMRRYASAQGTVDSLSVLYL